MFLFFCFVFLSKGKWQGLQDYRQTSTGDGGTDQETGSRTLGGRVEDAKTFFDINNMHL